MSQSKFWPAFESVIDAATEADWRRATGLNFPVVRRWLRPIARKALTVPVEDEHGVVTRWMVVEHSPTDVVAVCEESGQRRALGVQEIVLYAADREAIRAKLAELMELEPAPKGATIAGCVRVGAVSSAGKRRWVDLCWHADEGDLLRAGVGWASIVSAESVLLTPTRAGWSEPLLTHLDDQRKRLEALESVVVVEPDGSWRCEQAYLENWRLAKTLAPADAPTFRIDNGRWHVAFDGESDYPPDRVGFHYIRILLANPYQPFVPKDLFESRSGIRLAQMSHQPRVDAVGFRALREKVLSLTLHRAAAEKDGDPAVIKEIDDERIGVEQELDLANNLHGRARTLEGGEGSHRRSVSKAIDKAALLLGRKMPKFARYLDSFIKKGNVLVYQPDVELEWLT